jgi:molybdate transport system ATP-binding protein
VLEVDIRGHAGENPLEIELSVENGSCLALAGPSGVGKTTLLRMICGLARPDSGHIVLGSRVLFDSERDIDVAPELRNCGCVFQDYALFPHLAAWRNVAYAVRGSKAQRREKAITLLKRLDAADLADARPGELSGGERQRVALARAIASEPELLLFDEPLGALDVRTRSLAAKEIASVVDELDVPALLVTHDFVEAMLLGQSVAVMEHGEIVQRGSAEELAIAPATAFIADLTGANLLRGTARAGGAGVTEVQLDGGGTAFSSDVESGAVALSVQPWEVVIEPKGAAGTELSMQNRLSAEITSLMTIGNRVRVGLTLPQPLIADVTTAAVEQLGLVEGSRVTASFKASAARLHPR